MPLENENMLGMCAQNRLLMLLENSLAEPRAKAQRFLAASPQSLLRLSTYAPDFREYVRNVCSKSTFDVAQK